MVGTFFLNRGAKKGWWEPFAVGLPQNQDSPNYNTVFIARSSSGLVKLTDIKGKRLIINNKNSTSGYIVPKKRIKEH